MRKEYEFLANNPKLLSQYRGEWIAVSDSKVIAHGKDFIKVEKEAKKITNNPVFMQIPKEEVCVYFDRISSY
jgi:hypothetical protein